jgi:Sulfotransferase family
LTDRPIFLCGIQRGGTNQLLNVLHSHPRTCWPDGEFHEVFRGRGWRRALREDGVLPTLRKWRHYAPIYLRAGDLFDLERPVRGRAHLEGARGRAVRAGLESSAAANRPAVMDLKRELARRGYIDLAEPDRLTVKLMNYNLAFAEALAALYPGSVFVGLIRDGRAVCEGHVSRGAGVEAAAAAYTFVGRRLIELEAAGLPLRTWRFEDFVAEPQRVSREIYAFCELDPAAVRGVHLLDKKRILDASGTVRGLERVPHFYAFADMARHMRPDVNASALARLPAGARAAIEERCAATLAHFDYA